MKYRIFETDTDFERLFFPQYKFFGVWWNFDFFIRTRFTTVEGARDFLDRKLRLGVYALKPDVIHGYP